MENPHLYFYGLDAGPAEERAEELTVQEAFDRNLLTEDEVALLILKAAEREVRRDFRLQSVEEMKEADYKFEFLYCANSSTEWVIVFYVRDTSMFSYTNYWTVYANSYHKERMKPYELRLMHIVGYLEGDAYSVELKDKSVPMANYTAIAS